MTKIIFLCHGDNSVLMALDKMSSATASRKESLTV